MRGSPGLLALLLSAFPAHGQAPPDPQPLTLRLRVGGVVAFGDNAEAGTAPFAQLRAVALLSSSDRPWRLVTTLELTAAPGGEFEIESPETFKAVDLALALAMPLRRSWSPRGLLACGVQARAFSEDDLTPPARRRCGAGILLEGPTAHISITGGWDERLAGGWGALVEGHADIQGPLGFVGSAVVGRSVTIRLAVVTKF